MPHLDIYENYAPQNQFGNCRVIMYRQLIIIGLFFLVHTQAIKGGRGLPCKYAGVQGICAPASVCPSVALHIDLAVTAEPCPNDGDVPQVCCTDCHLYDISNAAVTLDGIVWKTAGLKISYDKCVEYASTLPYVCKTSGTRLSVTKTYDEKSGCHRLNVIVKQGPAPASPIQRVDFPHLALLGYGSTWEGAGWFCQGFIISTRFVLAAAHCDKKPVDPVSFVAVGINKRSEDPSRWQKVKVKTFHRHPEYQRPIRYNDIGLVETETDIKFGVNVLPICLADQRTAPEVAQIDILAADDQHDNAKMSVKKIRDEACTSRFPPVRHLKNGVNHSTMICYEAEFSEDTTSCRGSSGRPIYISGELKCMDFAVGLVSFGSTCGLSGAATVYTRIEAYLPWIEATVWPKY